jgi:hypothetical protein
MLSFVYAISMNATALASDDILDIYLPIFLSSLHVNDDTAGNKGQIKKTGQTKSYDENGNKVTDGSIKDDGYYQIGVMPSYTRDDAKKIVTDHITGLEWQDDVELVSESWEGAKTYCANLSLDGGGWRLPTQKELWGITHHSRNHPTINPVFMHTESDNYWSSTSPTWYKDGAWGVNFYYGSVHVYHKNNSYYVRCVRTEQ